MNPDHFFLLVTLLFSLGIVGIISRKNLFVIYMSVELMLSSVSLLLATLSKLLADTGGSVIALLLIGIIAAEAALFLAMIVHLYRRNKTVDVEHYNTLKEEL